MKQIIKTGKGLLYKIEHPVEIPYSEITLDSILKLALSYFPASTGVQVLSISINSSNNESNKNQTTK